MTTSGINDNATTTTTITRRPYSVLTEAVLQHAAEVVFTEDRAFTRNDFVPEFKVGGEAFTIAYGTFRDTMSRLMKDGEVVSLFRSPQAFYTVPGGSKRTTTDHTGGTTRGTNAHILSIIMSTPLGERAIHDLRLLFHLPGLWAVASTIRTPDPANMDTVLIEHDYGAGRSVRVVVHHTDNVSVMVACSQHPFTLNPQGILAMMEILTRTEERLSHML